MGLDQTRRPRVWARTVRGRTGARASVLLDGYVPPHALLPLLPLKSCTHCARSKWWLAKTPTCPTQSWVREKIRRQVNNSGGSGALQPRPEAQALCRCLTGPRYFFLAKDLLRQLDEIVED